MRQCVFWTPIFSNGRPNKHGGCPRGRPLLLGNRVSARELSVHFSDSLIKLDTFQWVVQFCRMIQGISMLFKRFLNERRLKFIYSFSEMSSPRYFLSFESSSTALFFSQSKKIGHPILFSWLTPCYAPLSLHIAASCKETVDILVITCFYVCSSYRHLITVCQMLE